MSAPVLLPLLSNESAELETSAGDPSVSDEFLLALSEQLDTDAQKDRPAPRPEPNLDERPETADFEEPTNDAPHSLLPLTSGTTELRLPVRDAPGRVPERQVPEASRNPVHEATYPVRSQPLALPAPEASSGHNTRAIDHRPTAQTAEPREPRTAHNPSDVASAHTERTAPLPAAVPEARASRFEGREPAMAPAARATARSTRPDRDVRRSEAHIETPGSTKHAESETAPPYLRDAEPTPTAPVPRAVPVEAHPTPPLPTPSSTALTSPRAEAPTPTPVAPEALPVQVEWLAERGGGRARIALHPAHLGHVEVEVRTRGGDVEVVISIEESVAHAPLAGQRQQLSDALAARDLQLTQFDVSDENSHSGRRSGSDLSERNPQASPQSHRRRHEPTPHPPDDHPVVSRTSTGIDVLI